MQKLVGQNFDRYLATEPRVSGPINDTHSSPTKRSGDFIVSKVCPGLEVHG